MKSILLFFACLMFAFSTQAQDTLKYRISLTDKAETEYSLKKPQKFLSKKAIERRKRQGLRIDSTDLPVCQTYIDAIRNVGVKIVVTGKWDNFVTVSCHDSTLIDRIAQLPFVAKTERVWIAPNMFEWKGGKRDSLINNPKIYKDSIYGPAITQIQMSKADKLHEAGFRGQGMTIAVIDAGFHNADRITAMQNIQILGTKDFVDSNAD
ncbi:MAG: serine protease, partial [Bacteroides sp.]|nr:serine protease [Bacteroides sp.]